MEGCWPGREKEKEILESEKKKLKSGEIDFRVRTLLSYRPVYYKERERPLFPAFLSPLYSTHSVA